MIFTEDGTEHLYDRTFASALTAFQKRTDNHFDPRALDQMGHPVQQIIAQFRIVFAPDVHNMITKYLGIFIVLHSGLLCNRQATEKIKHFAVITPVRIRIKVDSITLTLIVRAEPMINWIGRFLAAFHMCRKTVFIHLHLRRGNAVLPERRFAIIAGTQHEPGRRSACACRSFDDLLDCGRLACRFADNTQMGIKQAYETI